MGMGSRLSYRPSRDVPEAVVRGWISGGNETAGNVLFIHVFCSLFMEAVSGDIVVIYYVFLRGIRLDVPVTNERHFKESKRVII